MVTNLPASPGAAEDGDSIPGSERSPGGGNGHPLQSSCLENPMDGGAWQATAHRDVNSRTGLNDWACVQEHLLRQDEPELNHRSD